MHRSEALAGARLLSSTQKGYLLGICSLESANWASVEAALDSSSRASPRAGCGKARWQAAPVARRHRQNTGSLVIQVGGVS